MHGETVKFIFFRVRLVLSNLKVLVLLFRLLRHSVTQCLQLWTVLCKHFI